MSKSRISVWVWYAVLAAIVAGLFVPTIIAKAGSAAPEPSRCPTRTM